MTNQDNAAMTDQDKVARDLMQRAHAEEVRPTFDVEAGVYEVLARAKVELPQYPAPGPVTSPAVTSGVHRSPLARRPEMPVSDDDRLHRIQSLTDSALAHLDVEHLLAEPLDQVREILQVDTATVLLVDSSSQQLVATAASGIEAEVHQGMRIPMGKGFAGRIAAEKRPVIVDRVDHTNVLDPILRERGISSLLGVPLLSSGTLIGVLHVGTLARRRFTDDDVRLLQIVADQVAIAAQSRRAELEWTAAAVLQRSLLPARLPVVAGLELAARYVPAESGGVSGDWYDVFTLPSGWLCLVIGDVVGRGLHAADVTGQLRSALRAYALLGGDSAEVLGRVDQQMQHFDPETMATVLLAMFEPSLERLHVSSAGHPPPVLALPGQPAALLDAPSDHPVGVPGGLRRRTTTITLPPGALLCFYTDGLVKRRDASLDVRLERLCASVVAGPVDSVCATVMAQLVGEDPASDDVAVLAVRRQDSGEIGPLDLVLPAQPWSLRDIRVAVRRWLSAVGAAPRTVADLLAAVGEACTNAVRHAYGPDGGTVSVHLELQPPDVLATVRDTGHWRPPRGEHQGHGMLIMRDCSDDLRIDRGPTGTTVVIRRSLANRHLNDPCES
jgi:anti-sigma regulatory factor (Ser/Thr protein kinase)/putative methionine-R-sulfoxide reductase with GAF domain